MAKASQSQEEEVSEDALLKEAEEVETSEDDLLREAQATSAAPPPSPPASTGPTFYVRDAKGGLQPISYDNALRANAMGLKVLSEAEVRALSAAAAAAPAEPPPPPKDPGLARTLGRGLLQGFFKQGADEGAGAIASAGTDLGPNAQYRMPDGTMRPLKSGDDVYRAVRDTEREIERGMREHRPVTTFLANMVGDIGSDAVLSALGVPVASTPYQVASGALSGLLGSDAELSTDNVEGRDVASAAGSTAIGAGLGYVLPKVGTQVARMLPGAMASLRQGLENKALDKVRKVLTSGSGQLARRKPVSAEAAREALDSGAIPIWGTTQGAFERLKETAEIRGKAYADILTDLESAGVRGPNAEALAKRFAAEGADRRANSGANKSVAAVFENEAANIRTVKPEYPDTFQIVGEGPLAVKGQRLPKLPEVDASGLPPAQKPPVTGNVETKVSGGEKTEAVEMLRLRDERGKFLPRDKRFAPEGHTQAAPPPPAAAPEVIYDAPPVAPPARPLKKPIQGPTIETLPLSQAERIKRALQAEARFDKMQATGLDEAKQEVSSMYREAIERAIEDAGAAAPPGSQVADLAERFVPTKRQLARTLEARDAAERGAGAAAHRVGGAAGVNLFDVANAANATGTKGIPAMLIAGAGRIWKERGPSTLANVYDVGAEAAQNLGRWAGNNPETARAAARVFSGPFGRQLAASTMAEEAVTPVEDRDAQVQRALAEYLKRRQSGN